jgi:hypothetical protein
MAAAGAMKAVAERKSKWNGEKKLGQGGAIFG